MFNRQVHHITQAVTYLNYARYQVLLALGDTDAAKETVSSIDDLLEDLDADLIFFQAGTPRKTSV